MGAGSKVQKAEGREIYKEKSKDCKLVVRRGSSKGIHRIVVVENKGRNMEKSTYKAVEAFAGSKQTDSKKSNTK